MKKNLFKNSNLVKVKIVKKGKKIAFLNLGTRLNQIFETSEFNFEKIQNSTNYC